MFYYMFRSIMDNLTEENANDNIKVFSGLLVEIEKVGIKNLRILISHNCSEKVHSNLYYFFVAVL